MDIIYLHFSLLLYKMIRVEGTVGERGEAERKNILYMADVPENNHSQRCHNH